MGKKRRISSEQLQDDSFFGELNNLLDNFEDSYGCLMNDESYIPIRDYIDTGSYMLNSLISGDIFKGVPSGKIVQFAGEEATGKTYLALNICKNAILKSGYSVIYFDSENAIDYEQLSGFGLTGNKFRHQLVNSVEQLATMCKQVTNSILERGDKEPPKILIVIDSIGNLSTTKEISDVLSGQEKEDMTRPKRLKKLFRVLTTDFARTQIPCILVNHVYSNTSGFIGGNIIGGGTGTKYNSSIIVELGKAQLKDGDLRTGTLVTCKLSKSRTTTIGVKKKFIISFKKSLNRFIGLQTFANDDKTLLEIYEKVGIGIGKINKDGSFSPASIKKLEEFTKTGYVVDGKNVKLGEFFSEATWTYERLEKINEFAKRQLTFGGEDNEIEIENDDSDFENE